jgi:succinyl-diaminopimelate desuccinylase
MSGTVELATELIRLPSVTPDDAGCMDVLAARLQPLGFVREQLDFGETRNLWLRRGTERPLLVFLGHTDVVPPGPLDEWQSPPFEPGFREGMLYGRGAADMKGSVAAMTTALARFAGKYPHHRGSVALLMTSDEEGAAADGVARVMASLQARGDQIDWCVIGEPSSFERLGDVVRIGLRGSLCGVLTVFGIQGHVAYPERADNPIHRAAPALADLCAEVWDHGNEFFPPTSFQISNIHSGAGTENVIPGRLEILFNFRFSTASTEAELKRRTAAILDRHGLRHELAWLLAGAPFFSPPGELLEALQQALETVVGRRARPDTGGGTSDGRFVAPTGAQVVELGPLNSSIHKVNEHVPVDDIETLSAIYERVLVNLLA